jgi:hypothetical protein
LVGILTSNRLAAALAPIVAAAQALEKDRRLVAGTRVKLDLPAAVLIELLDAVATEEDG